MFKDCKCCIAFTCIFRHEAFFTVYERYTKLLYTRKLALPRELKTNFYEGPTLAGSGYF